MNIAVWLIAFGGLCAFWIVVGKAHAAAAPLLAACTVTLLVYVFGLIGLLQAGLYSVLAVGVLSAGYVLWKAPKTFLRWELLALPLGCALLWLRYKDAALLQYDDFSHWGLIARHLLTAHALPDQSSVLITFQSYPPAAACWIYAVCAMLGRGEGMMITAQAWLTLIALLPLLSVCGKPKFWRSLGLLVPAVIVLSMYQGTASLMVDNLLPALSIGAAAILAANRKALQKAAWPLAAVLTVLCLVKDSGLYFALMILIMLLYARRRYRQPWGAALPPLLLPIAGRALWALHLSLAFAAAEHTRHAFSLSNLQSVSADRTWDTLWEISKTVLQRVLRPGGPVIQLLFLMLCFCLGLAAYRYFATHRLRFADEVRMLLFSGLSYGLYLLLLVGMYFFTMPLPGALQAVAFERYNASYALFLYGLFAVYVLLLPLRTLKHAPLLALLCAAALAVPVLIPAYRGGIRRLLKENYSVPVRTQIAQLSAAHPLLPDEMAAIYVANPGVQLDFVHYIAAYTFQRDLPVLTAETLSEIALPAVLYALGEDDALRAAERRGGVLVVGP